MKHFCRIGLALLLYAGLLGLFGFFREQEPLPASLPDTGNTSAPTLQEETVSDPVQARESEAWIQELTARTKRAEMLAVASEAMPASRREAQLRAYPAWSMVLSTNTDKYSNLLAAAHQDPGGQVVCTICDSLSYMPCVMCQDHKGKCTQCGGTGNRGADVLCPACLGKGKCYLCSGSGKMFCPFCNDGMIDIKFPPPSLYPP